VACLVDVACDLVGVSRFFGLTAIVLRVAECFLDIGSISRGCQGSEGPWRTTVLRNGSRVAERMSIRPSAYKASHNVMPMKQVEEGVMLTDALYW
jgi:hypothetical protein